MKPLSALEILQDLLDNGSPKQKLQAAWIMLESGVTRRPTTDPISDLANDVYNRNYLGAGAAWITFDEVVAHLKANFSKIHVCSVDGHGEGEIIITLKVPT